MTRLMPSYHPLHEGIFVGTLITALAYLIGRQFSEIPFDLEFLAVWTSFICTYMFVIQTRWCYAMGVITTAIYSWVFWEANLIGSMALNIYLVPTLIYGYFIWGPDSRTKPVQNLQMKWLPVYLGFTILTYLGALGLISIAGGEMAPLDSWILIGTVLAQFLLDRKQKSTWIVWGAVNIVSIWVYLNADLPFVAVQYCFFLMNTGFGWWMWDRSTKKREFSFA